MAKQQHVVELHYSELHSSDFVNNDNTIGIDYHATHVIVSTAMGDYNLPKHKTLNIFAGTVANGIKAHVSFDNVFHYAKLRYWA
jgi:hypothetical protein